jgi:hypothetical protein
MSEAAATEAPEPADAEAADGAESGGEAAPDPPARPGGAGFRFRDSVGFVRDESHPRWWDPTVEPEGEEPGLWRETKHDREAMKDAAAALADDEGDEDEGDDEGGDNAAGRNRPDDEENPGNLGPIVRGWSDAEAPRPIEGSPFVTPTVPLRLRRAVHTNDMEIVREMVNRWNSAGTTGDSDADSVSKLYATAMFDEHSRDTLLHVAVRKRYVEMVRYLVSQGARRSAVNRRERTPVGIARTMLENLGSWDDCPIGMELSGHPNISVNGVYTQRGEHAGFPRYTNEHGIHLWHNQPSGAWLIHREFTPDADLCLAGFGGSVERVPSGTAHPWVCAIPGEGGRHEERVLTVSLLQEEGLRNAVEAAAKPKGVRMFRGMSYDAAYDTQQEAGLAKNASASGSRQRRRPKRGGGATRTKATGQATGAMRLPGLTLSERRAVGATALAETKAVLKALRGCFAQFQTSNFAAGAAPWAAPESAWAGGPPEGEPHAAWAENDPVTIKMHPHPDRMIDCTAKPGGWQDEMAHRKEKGKRKPVLVAGLPGLLAPDTPGWAPPTDKVMQRPMKARIAKAHAVPKKWASANHTVRSQIGQHHTQAYEALVGSILERKRTPGWLQGAEKGFHRAHSRIPVDTSGGGWK